MRTALRTRSLAAFDMALPPRALPAEPISIPFSDVHLPGYFFACANDDAPRPTVIICGGGDGSGEESYFFAGVPEALQRGLNIVVFHGPGQRGVLHRYSQLTFRRESEDALAPVLDHTAARPDVDANRIALYGLSFGGYHVCRAVAFDDRVAALVANAPIRDMAALVTAGVLDQVPTALRPLTVRHLDGGNITYPAGVVFDWLADQLRTSSPLR